MSRSSRNEEASRELVVWLKVMGIAAAALIAVAVIVALLSRVFS